MKIQTTIYITIFLLCLSSVSQAALEARLGGLAVYDTDLNITWLADANAGLGSSFDSGLNHRPGAMTWSNANAWAASLNIGGVTGWRLPTADPACVSLACPNSEMGHLFYNELGGTVGSLILNSGDPDLALFSNIQQNIYWTGTLYAPDHNSSWAFTFNAGRQFFGDNKADVFAWAVHDGDVGGTSAVSEPRTIILIGLGLVGLLCFSRRQQLL